MRINKAKLIGEEGNVEKVEEKEGALYSVKGEIDAID